MGRGITGTLAAHSFQLTVDSENLNPVQGAQGLQNTKHQTGRSPRRSKQSTHHLVTTAQPTSTLQHHCQPGPAYQSLQMEAQPSTVKGIQLACTCLKAEPSPCATQHKHSLSQKPKQQEPQTRTACCWYIHTAAPTHTATLSLSVFLSKSTLCTQYTTAKYRTTVQYPISWPTTQLQGKNATSRHERTVACWLADCYSWLLDLLSSSWGTSDTYKQILFLTHNSTHGCTSTTQNLARYCENPDKVL